MTELNGLIIPPKNATAIAAAVSRALDDRQLKQKLENNAFELAKNDLSFDTMMNKPIELYEKI